jgi:hypothetical protein
MSRSLPLSCLALALTACSTAVSPPRAVLADAPPEPEKIDTGPTSMESETGGLNEEAVEKAFASLDVNRCIEQRGETFGGKLKLKLRIDRRGGARWAYVSGSNLGDRDAEKCVLDLARAKSWPKPLGGDGIAEGEIIIKPHAEPATADERRTLTQIAHARTEADKCRRGVAGSFFATVYLEPDGSVATAGVSVPSEKGEEVADCVVEAVRKVRFQRAPKAAKLSFEIR